MRAWTRWAVIACVIGATGTALSSTKKGFQGTVTALDPKTRTVTWKSLEASGSQPQVLTATWDAASRFERRAADSFEVAPVKPESVKIGTKVYAEAVDEHDDGRWRLKKLTVLP